MHTKLIIGTLVLTLTGVIANRSIATELPASFPSDVPVADFMELVNVAQVRDDFIVDFHAEDQTMDGVAEWIIAEMTAAGWNLSSDGGHSRSRIIVFMKGSRRCGFMVTNSVMSPSMEMLTHIKGVQYQCSGGGDTNGEDAVEATMDAAAEGAAQ